MRAFKSYKHENCMNAFIYVNKIQYRDNKRIKVRVNWFTDGYIKPINLGVVETIEIKREDLSKWKEID